MGEKRYNMPAESLRHRCGILYPFYSVFMTDGWFKKWFVSEHAFWLITQNAFNHWNEFRTNCIHFFSKLQWLFLSRIFKSKLHLSVENIDGKRRKIKSDIHYYLHKCLVIRSNFLYMYIVFCINKWFHNTIHLAYCYNTGDILEIEMVFNFKFSQSSMCMANFNDTRIFGCGQL